jgi:hypothetical protein
VPDNKKHMQLFVQLSTTGKTVSVDVQADWTLQQVLNNVNERVLTEDDVSPFDMLIYKKAFYEEEYPMTVVSGSILRNDVPLVSLYEKGIIKEITLLACKTVD